jgi:hypothetical protein
MAGRSLGADYKDAPVTQEFYATVQNKLHCAIHGRTAAEVITERADQEFSKHEAAIRICEATQPISDFDKAVEQIKRLEQRLP